MKRIAFLILSVLLTVSVFAQDPGATEKNAGNAAVKAKNYPEAFKQYEAYLKIVNNKDNATVYNTAYCATKIRITQLLRNILICLSKITTKVRLLIWEKHRHKKARIKLQKC